MGTELSSERLDLRPLAVTDGDALHALWTTEPVRRHLWDGEVIPRRQTDALLAENAARFDVLGSGLWGLYPRSGSELVGFAGYWPFHDPPRLELLFGLAEAWQRRGLAAEASRVVIEYGRERLGFERVLASTDAANTASQRLLEVLGLRCTDRKASDGRETLFYELALLPAPSRERP